MTRTCSSSSRPTEIGVRRTWKALVPIIAPGQVLLDVRVHPLDDRHDDDQEADGDDDAEEGEEGAELGTPDGLEREAEGFEEGHEEVTGRGKAGAGRFPSPRPTFRYSYLSASTGSSRDALLAG